MLLKVLIIKLFLNTKNRGCKFTRFQDGKLQEMPEEVPVGHIPRSITLHFRGDMTRCALPGDRVTITGVFLPTPYTGFRAMRAGFSFYFPPPISLLLLMKKKKIGLIADTYLDVCNIVRHKKSYTNVCRERKESEKK